MTFEAVRFDMAAVFKREDSEDLLKGMKSLVNANSVQGPLRVCDQYTETN